MDNSKTQNDRIKLFVRIPSEKNEKRNAARQIIEESRVCDYLSCFIDDTNALLAHAYVLIIVALVMDESDDATNAVRFDKTTRRFLDENVDPIAVSDFIEPVCEKVEFANKETLRSFKLRVVIEPPEQEGGAA